MRINGTERQFAHKPRFDDRSRMFSMSLLVPADRAPRSYTWRCNTHLDQGATSACTGFAFAHHRLARPEWFTCTRSMALDLYADAKTRDEWAGEDYDGTSVLAAALAARHAGWIRSFHWGFTEEQVARTVAWVGPVVAGTLWTTGMTKPDRRGFIRADGGDIGGHAYLLRGINVRTGRLDTDYYRRLRRNT